MTVAALQPTSLAERVLAPDLARGVMLLFIALANSHYFLQDAPTLGGFPRDVHGVDAIVTGVIATTVDGRAFPMFAALFGYGLVQMYSRRRAAGDEWRPTRKLLRRRSLWMLAIGVLHGLFLYVGDIVAAYGLLAFLLVPIVRWKDRWIVALAVLAFAIVSAPGMSDSLVVEAADGPDPTMLPQSLWSQFADRGVVIPILVVLLPIGLAFPFLVGILAARHRVLEEPDRHRTLLRVVAVGGIAVAWAGGLPAALVLSGAAPEKHLEVFAQLHDATGLFGGLGYAAAIALLARGIGDRRGLVTTAVAAVGQRSLTCYLSQSVVWTLVFTPYLLDLTGVLTVTGVAVIATGTWLATVLAAYWMHRRGLRGPMEVLLRRLTYRQGVWRARTAVAR